ncbi:phosphoribosylanthranilate isomerase [Pseudomethylobacillus aquaticus]|uniref:N-(5'-phosphoribosyl)anthranilate isomerase n=1 Tax=Pseudomethylobacillus aquaticus TaxID=2676064 RepID=A0A3N0V7G2_9PROT|nr:phosphoribosylanthranilate isomerase [Pseudomethylobacillus aquaticus]ROH88561.1 phosphoribosylanthranilate isomerase [Pseudomethylobacillus aquaticus]
MRTRVKICGITRVEDALAAVAAGADAIGLVFYAPSPRCVSVERAAEIAAAIPAFVSVVGLFVDASRDQVEQVLQAVPLDLLQFHGEEPPDYCRQFARPYIKAVAVREGTNLLQYAADYHDARGLLLDTYHAAMPGGTGQVFDWGLIPADLARPVILAGGLQADNVAQAIAQVRPYAVDVSGGVEQSKGIKDAARMAAFMRGVGNASV